MLLSCCHKIMVTVTEYCTPVIFVASGTNVFRNSVKYVEPLERNFPPLVFSLLCHRLTSARESRDTANTRGVANYQKLSIRMDNTEVGRGDLVLDLDNYVYDWVRNRSVQLATLTGVQIFTGSSNVSMSI